MSTHDFGFDFGNSVAKGAIFNPALQPQYCGIPSVTAEGTLAALNDIRQASGVQGDYQLHDDDYILVHGDAELYVGRLALAYSSDPQETRGDINRYWSEQALQFLLTLSGSLIFDRDYALNVVTGLPAQTYDAINRRRVRDALEGEHAFWLNGVPRRANVTVSKVVQEGAGGIVLYGTREPVKQAVIDIGGRTTDIFAARGQEPVKDQCKGYPKGVEDATDLLNELAQAGYGRVLTIAERRAILQAYALSQPYPDIPVSGHSMPRGEMEAWAEQALRKTGGLIRTFVSKTLRSSERGSVAAIVSEEMQEEIMRNLQCNQRFSTRNNKQGELTLLRAGFAKCGNCGRNVSARIARPGSKYEYIYYRCTAHMNGASRKCIGCSAMNARTVDDAAWQKAVEIIRDPSIVDAAVAERRSKDPTASRRKQINKEIASLEAERGDLQADLLRMIRERSLDRNTEGVLTNRLKEIEKLVNQLNSELLDDEKIHQQWDTAQRKLEKMHQRCAVMREKLDDPAYEPDYKTKRDLIEFFGITATIWETGHKPRFKIQFNPTEIVSSHRWI